MKILKTAGLIFAWLILFWLAFYVGHISKVWGTWAEIPLIITFILIVYGALILCIYITIKKIWRKEPWSNGSGRWPFKP